MTPLKRPEYVKIKLSDVPEEIIVEYKLHNLANADGSVYVIDYMRTRFVRALWYP